MNTILNLKVIYIPVLAEVSLAKQYEDIITRKKKDPSGLEKDAYLGKTLINQLNRLLQVQKITQTGGIIKNFFQNLYDYENKKIGNRNDQPNIIRAINSILREYGYQAERIPGNRYDILIKPIR